MPLGVTSVSPYQMPSEKMEEHIISASAVFIRNTLQKKQTNNMINVCVHTAQESPSKLSSSLQKSTESASQFPQKHRIHQIPVFDMIRYGKYTCLYQTLRLLYGTSFVIFECYGLITPQHLFRKIENILTLRNRNR